MPNLLKVALKNEVEATEIAARWLVDDDDVDVKLAFARQVGDEARHYRLIARSACARSASIPTRVDPLAKGFGPLFTYLDSLHDHRGARGGGAVHARGDRGREEPPVHRVLRARGRRGDRDALSRRHRARRALSPRARSATAAAARDDARRAGCGAPRARGGRWSWRKSCRPRRWRRPASITRRAADGVAARVRGAGADARSPRSTSGSARCSSRRSSIPISSRRPRARRASTSSPRAPAARRRASPAPRSCSRTRASRGTRRTTTIRATAA